MRLFALALCVVLVAGLAGCTTPEKEATEDPLFGLCPQWDQGHGGQTTGLHLAVLPDNVDKFVKEERELAAVDEMWENHTLDLFRVRIESLNLTGHLELRAFAAAPGNKQLGIRDYRSEDGPEVVPVIILSSADIGQEFDVLRSAVTHGSAPAPLPLRLQFTLEGEGADAIVQYSVTFLYKVCGADA